MKKIVVVRHGNTFRPEELPRRVGRTDLPLVEECRSRSAGRFLLEHAIVPDFVYASPLKRTMQSARLILDEMNRDTEIQQLDFLKEIDYGPDEDKTEPEVELRLGEAYLRRSGVKNASYSQEDCILKGKEVIDLWNKETIPPFDWLVDKDAIIQSWKDFFNGVADDATTLVVSSNGIIRFSPYALREDEFAKLKSENSLKVTTGGIVIFEDRGSGWTCTLWNRKPAC